MASAFGFGPEIFELLENDPDAFDAEILAIMEKSDFLHWGFVDSMWHHGVDTPSGLMNEIKRFNIEDMMGNITTATLVVDADAETRAQAPELYEGLTGAVQRDYLKFSAEEAAQFHDQPGAVGIQYARIFNWLDDVLEPKTYPSPVRDSSDDLGVESLESDNSAAPAPIMVGVALILLVSCCSAALISGFLF